MKFDPFFLPEDSGNNTVFKLSDIDPVDLASGGWDSHMRFVPSQMRARTWISIWTALSQGVGRLGVSAFRHAVARWRIEIASKPGARRG